MPSEPPDRIAAGASQPVPAAADAAAWPRAAVQRELLMRHAPFSEMTGAHVDRFIAAAEEVRYASGEPLLRPQDGPVRHLYLVRAGAVTGRRELADGSISAFRYEPGDLFPAAALMGAHAVGATYTATEDSVCLRVPAAAVHALAAQSAPFADALSRRIQQFLELSRRSLQAAYAQQALAEQSMERRLGDLPHRPAIACPPGTPLADALGTMHRQRIGSMLVCDARGVPLGILTRHDVLGRVTLAGVPLHTPIGDVMSRPLHLLSVDHRVQDAALLMSRHGVRHVPITDRTGVLVGMVSERDLFVMQRLSLKQLSTALRAAPDAAALKPLAADIRELAHTLLGQGVLARQLTELVSHLNDLLTTRLVELVAGDRGLPLERACWLAFGSEGREEQTISTDQDNGLVFVAAAGGASAAPPDAERSRWLGFAREVNDALDACGYPLCKGNVMAGNPDLCLTVDEWRARFDHWLERGTPEDLLSASICFDLRPIAGRLDLAAPLRELIVRKAPALPRFCKLLADDVLRRSVPLNWFGAIETTRGADGRERLDLKLHGTAIFVEAARLESLALGIDEVNTRRRLAAVARAGRAPVAESEAWIGAFEFLQRLRLQVQFEAAGAGPNQLEPSSLNQIDRRVLKEALLVARRLQQRIEMDYGRR